MKDVVYEVSNDEAGVIAQVLTWPNIMWKYRVILHDMDAGEQIEGMQSFKHLSDAEAYADMCVDSY